MDKVEDYLLDELDRQIIQATQSGLPLVSKPYHAVADHIGISVDDLMDRMRDMQQSGVIRRIAAVPNHYKLGYHGNAMTVWDVPDTHISKLGRKIGRLDFVSHCYQRPRHLPDWPYNLFAMVHAHNRQEAMTLVGQIAILLGDKDCGHDVLFSTRILKKTGMRLLP